RLKTAMLQDKAVAVSAAWSRESIMATKPYAGKLCAKPLLLALTIVTNLNSSTAQEQALPEGGKEIAQPAKKVEQLQKTIDELRKDVEDARREIAAANAQAAHQGYLPRITLAQQEWQANNLSRAQQLLEQCPPRLRRWEWHYLKRVFHGGLLTVDGQICV